MNKAILTRIKNLGLSLGVLGCLFKLMSWAGAPTLLVLGLSLLALYFLLKVFEK
ncbi:MAG: gliding motility protein [Flavobacteriaceae bacterium]|nr:gliding motility protein [Flavobacteriaceae bacterium]